MTKHGPVFPIMPCFDETGAFDGAKTSRYVRYLEEHGATTVMTTAGTSQFNLLSTSEILAFNDYVSRAFSGRIILGAPPLSEIHLAKFLIETHATNPNAGFLLTYPERFYSSQDVVAFFERICMLLPNACFYIHGIPMRSARGGIEQYSSKTLNAIRAVAPNIVGIKEESATYESGFELCASVTNSSCFEFIVAGGSMRRFLLLNAAGAQSFFVGVGSLFPHVEISFHNHMMAGRLHEATAIITECETPIFHEFMPIGWHKALRYAAKYVGILSSEERQPMTNPTDGERLNIEKAVEVLKRNMRLLELNGVLQ